MQLKLPLFSRETKSFNASFGVLSVNKTVFYLHCAQPVGMHDQEDHNSFRHKTASFIEWGLCTQSKVVATLHVPPTVSVAVANNIAGMGKLRFLPVVKEKVKARLKALIVQNKYFDLII
jgi:hypothetical protein